MRDVDKFFLWTKDHGKVHKKKGFSKKVVVTGNLRFNDNLNYINKRKIKRIGITTTTRYTTSAISEINIPRLIFSRQHSPRFVSFIKQELEFFDAISNAELIDSIVKSFFVEKTNSTKETFGVGTLIATPSNLPFNDGIISPIAFDAPVEVGTID